MNAVSRSGGKEAAKEKNEEEATPWGWLGALTTAIAAIVGILITNRKNEEIARLTSELSRQKDLELEHQKFIDELRTEYDKDLRTHRIEHYLKLLA